jgi:lysophospholipase L1-like esterase
MKKLLVYILFFVAFAASAQTTRIKLVQIEKSNTVNGTKADQIPLSNGVGDLRYAQYTEINPTAIGYTPALTGNPAANYSQFVKPANGDIWYIDNNGRGVKLYVAASAGDYDWLEIGNNQIPNSITDSIYKYKYASVGGRLVWPTAEMLVIDSVAQGMFIVAGNRKAKIALYDTENQTWSTMEQGGGTTAIIMQLGGTFTIQTAGSGTPQAPGTPIVDHFIINPDSTIQLPQYKSTRNDPGSAVNILNTDATGKLRSDPVSSLSVPPSGSAGGSLTGTYPNPGIAVNVVDSTNVKSRSISGLNIALNTVANGNLVGGITLSKLDQSGATSNQVPQWNGSAWVPATVSGSGSTLKLDNFRLQGIIQRIPALGFSANENVTNYTPSSVNNVFYKFNTVPAGTSSTEYGGWLANGTSGDSISINAPYCVIIGDSQAEGHPNEHGRLHPNGVPIFTATYPDVYGTLSFKLRALTKMRWYNHGIGGQTSTQVWARWGRDVLAQNLNVGDGRGNQTLRLNSKPVAVVVIIGINDLYSGISTSTTISNLENMAKSARDNGIAVAFANLPGDTIITNNQLKGIDTLNTYFASGALQNLGAAVFDYNTWWKGTSVWNDNAHRGQWITDDIHPSRAGYDTLATYIFNTVKLPVLDSIIVYNQIGPGSFTGFSRPTGITLDQRSYTIPNTSIGTFKLGYGLSSDSVFLKIVASTNVSGTSFSGFSHILFKVANDTSGLSTRRSTFQGFQGKSVVVSSITGTGTTNYVPKFSASTTLTNSRIFDNGTNVGIGTISPAFPFEVIGRQANFGNLSSIALNLGQSGNSYPCVAYNVKYQTASNTYNYNLTDPAYMINFGQSGNRIGFNVAPSGTANSAITFTEAMTITNTFRVGINNSAPSYTFDINGTDGVRITSGTTAQRGTAATGVIRWNTDLNKMEGSGTGATYFPFDQTLYSATANTTVTNTTVVSNLASVTIPANSLAVGQTINVNLAGYINTDAIAPGNGRIGIVYGTDTIYSAVAAIQPISGGNIKTFIVQFLVRVVASGATGALRAQGFAQMQTDLAALPYYGGWYPFSAPTISNTTVNTTTAKTFSVFWQFGTADPDNGVAITSGTILRQ